MNEVEVLKKEYLKKRIIRLSDLLEVSAGYPAWNEYNNEQEKTINELLAIIKPDPKQSILKRIKIWLIKKLSD